MPRSYEALFANRKLMKKKQKYYFILLSLLIFKKTANLVMYWGHQIWLHYVNYRFEPSLYLMGFVLMIFTGKYLVVGTPVVYNKNGSFKTPSL
ncbi:hypothetical protein BpHYR1_030348 [Brachionus plicatilis]|uniref:Uncharacterized protein n=1 Tax=Brachionus plicatilis TaxID=10195 RepID=A0A3M7RCG9_BRAPC|nr:hypothetical protein BpHYR1_030348 [Brachionus plicatilis]